MEGEVAEGWAPPRGPSRCGGVAGGSGPDAGPSAAAGAAAAGDFGSSASPGAACCWDWLCGHCCCRWAGRRRVGRTPTLAASRRELPPPPQLPSPQPLEGSPGRARAMEMSRASQASSRGFRGGVGASGVRNGANRCAAHLCRRCQACSAHRRAVSSVWLLGRSCWLRNAYSSFPQLAHSQRSPTPDAVHPAVSS